MSMSFSCILIYLNADVFKVWLAPINGNSLSGIQETRSVLRLTLMQRKEIFAVQTRMTKIMYRTVVIENNMLLQLTEVYS